MRGIIRRRIPVTAVGSDEVSGVLRRLGLYEDVVEGRARCFICGERLSLENLGGVLMVDGRPVLVCDRPICIAKAALISRSSQAAAATRQD